MPDAPLLPELARSLRQLGTIRDACSQSAHTAVFQPLLEARAHATGATKESVLAAVRGSALAARIEALVIDAAVDGIAHPAEARALTAQAREIVDPLRTALLTLDALSDAAGGSEAGWDAWVAELKRAFAAADLACRDLAALIKGRPSGAGPSRWYAPKAR